MTDELVPSPPKLPLNGMNDKDQIIDGNGNIFEYDAEHDAWIYRGQIESPDLVTRDFDGLVYPSLYRRLLLIQELIDRGIDFGLFKLDTPGTIPYYYFFYSSDDLIRFYPQPNGKLRLELDRNRLYQKLLRSCCPGPKGQKGYQGMAGRDGVAASKEAYKYPKKASQGEFEFESIVNLPIDTAVSLRLFRGDTILVEYLIDVLHPDSSDYLTITIYDDTIEISTTNTEINFDKENSKVSGILSFTSGAGDISQWRYKIRQRGPKGNRGEDGSPFVSVSEQMLSDSSAKCGSMINSVRNSNLTNNIFTLSAQIPPDVCVSNLSISASSLPVGDTISARFAAAKVTTKKCKDIGYYQYEIPEYTPPDLELPSWEPTPDCVSAARYNSYKFEWWDLTDPKYPFRIIKPPRPNEQCCQEPMFWCPNVGDNPCVAEGTLTHTDKGLIPIEQLRNGSMVMCPDGKFRPIDKFYDNGMKECIKLTFSDGGEIVVTSDHKFPVGGQLIEAQHLQPFDQIHKAPGALGWLRNSRKGTKDDYERGYVLGYLMGDGWISRKSIGIVSNGADEDKFLVAYNILSRMFGKVKISNRKTEHDVTMLCAKWGSKNAKNYFVNNGWYKNLTEYKIIIPNSIYTENYEFYSGFFAALINTDGCVNKNGEINICVSCTELLPKACHRILNYLGISSRLRSHHQVGTFGGDMAHRVDVLSESNKEMINLVGSGILNRKSKNAREWTKVHKHDFILPNQNNHQTLEYQSGLIAGAFMFHGGYNNKTRRAWIMKSMPSGLRSEISLALSTNIKADGKQYFWNADQIGKTFKQAISIDYAAGFARSALYDRCCLTKSRSLVFNRKNKLEIDLICGCLNALDIDYWTGFSKISEEYSINISNSHNIYKIFMLSNHRDKIGGLKLRFPTAGSGIVGIVRRESVGIKHVYDYKVSPHLMMAAEGIILMDCGVNHWRCGELEKLPSGAANANGLACNGEAREPILKAPDPYPPECDCDCDSPIAFDLQNGGMALKPMILSQSNLTQSDVQYSVIDGRTDTYKLNIKSTGITQVSIQLDWKREICGGNQEKNNCQYQENCQVHTTIIFEDNSQNAEISNGGASELSEIPSNITFTVKPLSGNEIDVDLNVMVNDTRSQCCRGYLIRMMAQGSPSQLLSQEAAGVEVVDINWGK